MKRRGISLMEVLIGLAVTTIAFGGIFTIFVTLDRAQTFSVTMPEVQQKAQQLATTVASALRRATLCTSSDSGCTINATLQDTSSTGLTVYTRSSGTLTPVTYEVSSGTFQKISGATTTPIYTDATLDLVYYQSSTYHSGALTEFTPDNTTTPNVIGMKIVATVTSGSHTATYSTVVRLRSGPKKSTPSD